jgi:transcriptional regulator with XRE-family HTH domain
MRKPPIVKEHPPEVARRLYWLERLIDEKYEGKPALFQERTKVSMSQVGQWFSGNRMLRENALATLAAKTGRPESWFDRPIPELGAPPVGLDDAIAARPGPVVVGAPADLRAALFTVGEAIKQADDETRGDVLKMLDLFLSSPKSNAGQLPLIIDRLLGELQPDQTEDEKKAA